MGRKERLDQAFAQISAERAAKPSTADWSTNTEAETLIKGLMFPLSYERGRHRKTKPKKPRVRKPR